MNPAKVNRGYYCNMCNSYVTPCKLEYQKYYCRKCYQYKQETDVHKHVKPYNKWGRK